MLKKTCILLLIATLPALAEPQFTSFEIFLLFLYGYILLVFDVLMFLSPLIFLVVIVIVIEKVFKKKKLN